jgi:hypothetical protein
MASANQKIEKQKKTSRFENSGVKSDKKDMKVRENSTFLTTFDLVLVIWHQHGVDYATFPLMMPNRMDL